MLRTDRVKSRLVSLLLCALLIALGVPLAPEPAAAFASVYVSSTTGSDLTGDGSYAAPYQTITKGVSEAYLAGGGNVYAMPGTYDSALGETFPIVLQQGVNVVGMWVGSGAVVDASGSGERAFYCEGGTSATGLERLLITGGDTDERGGGIRILNTVGENRPMIRSCTFTDNNATDVGGAISVENAKASIIDCDFSSNTGGNAGGAISAIGDATSVTISDCTFNGDSGGTSGGGVNVFHAVVAISGCTFQGTHVSSSWQGGAITVSSSAGFSLRDSTISQCTAGVGGGVYIDTVAYAAIDNTVFDRCSAAVRGGAIDAESSDMVISSSTFVGNTAVGSNDSIHDASAGPQTFEIRDTIVWDAAGDEIGPLAPIINYSCTSNPSISGIGIIHTDPSFVSTTDVVDYALRNGSPCIDTGNPVTGIDHDILGAERPLDGSGDTVARSDMGAYEHPVPALDRLQGTDRYKTACEIWRSRMSAAETAIIVTGENFPDALSASALAGAVHGPLLLVQQNAIPADVSALLTDLGVTDCIIVGGESAVSAGVESSLAADYFVTRIAGADRYATAAKVAIEVADRMKSDFPGVVFVATGASFPDALAASPVAYATGAPIILTRTASLPSDSSAVIAEIGATEAIAVGSTKVVSSAVYDQLASIGSITTRNRWYGDNRYETARAVATQAVARGYSRWAYTGIATGLNFPDALAGGAAVGDADGVLLLTDPATLSSATNAAITTNKAKIFAIHLFGSDKAVSTAVRNTIDALWP